MVRSKGILTVLTFLGAGGMAFGTAWFAAQWIERASIDVVRGELAKDGLQWVTVDANGLQVFLAGTAPDEATRFQAVSAAGRAVDATRVLDQMTVEDADGLRAPRFSLELLRNDAGLSLIGLVPTVSDKDALLDQIARRVGRNVTISEFVETADFDPPADWAPALDFAVSTLGDLPRSKISVEAGKVSIKGMAGSLAEKRRLEADLSRRAPDNVRLAMMLSAPRPVITPFTLRFVKDENGPRFDACSADTEDARTVIREAATRAGIEGPIECRLGLGVPSPRWGEAAALSMDALTELGGGSVTLSDADVSLIAPEGTNQGLFDRVVGQLESDLPRVFALTAVRPEAPDPEAEGPPEFVATRSPEGTVQLRGRVNSDLAKQTATSFAQARFGSDAVQMAARIDESLPSAWSIRVLAALEVLDELANGAVLVTPTSVSVSGNTGNANANADISGLLSRKLGEGQDFDIAVTYVERLDPTLGIPTPEECERQIVTIVGDRKLSFEPGSADLDVSAQSILDDIAELLRLCGDIPLEIQGHTDSQGRESMNLELSQARAQSVLDALRLRKVLTAAYTAQGYGEAKPIADNGTEEGREQNRRIEFRLIRPEVAETDETDQTDDDAASESEDSSE